MKTLMYSETIAGKHIDEHNLYKSFENFNNCSIEKSDTKLLIYRGQTLVLDLDISKVEQDFISTTYSATLLSGHQIRVCCINPQFAVRVGDIITFASPYKDGFAVQYEIK